MPAVASGTFIPVIPLNSNDENDALKPSTTDTKNQKTQKNEQEKPSENRTFANKTVTAEPAKKSIWHSIKNIPRQISIFFRAVGKVFVLGYYFIQHVLKGKPIDTPEKLNSIVNSIGPIFPKIMQPMLASAQQIDRFARCDLLKFPAKKYTFTKAEEKLIEDMKKAVKGFFDDIKTNDLTSEKAQAVLDSHFNGKYTVVKRLGAGTIASAYLVKDKNGNPAVAKVMSPNTEYQIAVGTKSLEFFTSVLPKAYRPIVRSTLSTFRDECNLSSEHHKLNAYRAAVLAGETEVSFEYTYGDFEFDSDSDSEFRKSNKVHLSFTVPETIEPADPSQDNVLIMKKAGGHTLAEILNNKPLFAEEFKKCFGRPPVYSDVSSEDEFESSMREIQRQVINKWNQVLGQHHIMHGDLHPGNIMIEFKPGGKLVISLIDLGNSHTLEKSELQFIKNFFSTEQEFVAEKDNITPKDMLKTKHNKLGMITGFEIKGKHKNEILKNLKPHEVEKMKKLFDLVMEQASDKTVSDRQKELIFKIMFYELANRRECDPTSTTINDVIAAFLVSGVGGLSPFIYKLGSALARGGLRLDKDIILTGKMPENKSADD